MSEITNKHVIAYTLGDGALYADTIEVSGSDSAFLYEDGKDIRASMISDGNQYVVTMFDAKDDLPKIFKLDFAEADRLLYMLSCMQPHRKYYNSKTWELKL